MIKKPSWLKKRKNAFLCLDQNICKTRSGNIKFGIKYPQHIHFPNVKENNFYMLTFCENNGSTKLAKKPNFLLHNAKPKNNLSGVADINYGQ